MVNFQESISVKVTSKFFKELIKKNLEKKENEKLL